MTRRLRSSPVVAQSQREVPPQLTAEGGEMDVSSRKDKET